jgi:hypothetical protein
LSATLSVGPNGQGIEPVAQRYLVVLRAAIPKKIPLLIDMNCFLSY